MEVIINYLFEHFPQIATYIIVIIIVAFLVYKVTKFYINTTHRNEDIGKMSKTLQGVERGFSTLNTLLLEKNVISQSCYTNENSPRVVSPKGEKVYQESGAKDLFEKIKDGLISELEANPKIDSLLDLERQSVNILLNKMENSDFVSLQNFAFEHPTFEGNPLTYTDLLFIIALKLRDYYREKHPDFGKTDAEDSK